MKVCVVTPFSKRGRVLSTGARLLVDKLNELGADATAAPSPDPESLCVSWGKPARTGLNPNLPPNKLWELQVCTAAGVSTVPFTTDLSQIVLAREGNWFGRLYSHTKGRDIEWIHPPPANPNMHWVLGTRRDFYTKLIPKHREYRVHIFGDKAVRSATKVKPDGSFTDTQPIWNLDHGFQIRYEHAAPKAAKDLAKAAVKAMELHFAAVDVIEATDGRLYFLEANTKPGLHGNTCLKYAEKILAVAEGKLVLEV